MEVSAGVPVALDRDVRVLEDGRVLLGGDPGRLLRLRTTQWRRGLERGDPTVGALARTLLDGGLAHPRPGPVPVSDVTVVVPVRDRVPELHRCLGALRQSAARPAVGGRAASAHGGHEPPVLVVDDGSLRPDLVAQVCREHHADLLRLRVNQGPAAARNAGLAATTSPVVAFLDSDCRPPADWLARLLGHLDDPRVGAVAPRVRAPEGGQPLLARYAGAGGPLDLGDREGPVRPGTRISYVPTAALLVRRTAMPEGRLDEALRYGEDVDLVWRLHDAGWQVRYDPRVEVVHDEPTTWRAWLTRRHRYGTSAGPLAERHGNRLTPLVVLPLPSAAWLLVLARRPLAAAAVAAVPAVRLARLLRRAGLSRADSARVGAAVTGQALRGAVTGLGGAGLVLTAPVLLALLTRRRTRWPAATALLVPPLLSWRRQCGLDPLRWTALHLVDDLAYASGVWRSCWTARTAAPLRPRLRRPQMQHES